MCAHPLVAVGVRGQGRVSLHRPLPIFSLSPNVDGLEWLTNGLQRPAWLSSFPAGIAGPLPWVTFSVDGGDMSSGPYVWQAPYWLSPLCSPRLVGFLLQGNNYKYVPGVCLEYLQLYFMEEAFAGWHWGDFWFPVFRQVKQKDYRSWNVKCPLGVFLRLGPKLV